MSELVNIIVDGISAAVPKNETVVDAAMRVGVKIPVFCHHPKLEPVGMCRMCLVRIGIPNRDRATGAVLHNEDGSVQYNWGRGLQTGCTVRVVDGMAIETRSAEVQDARDDILEFILTSHPLDCPICDKGGECPLQNLTMAYGNDSSRFRFDEKMKLDKHVPLGELIYLDRERCIQCARCTRFQDEIAGDPVIAFHNRGRRLEIVTLSDPGFDSIWSGNTTDICPVGALTTADFRFGARIWELTPVASISPHGPVGENITISTRREARSGGRSVIKRIMPRQNEWVNEIWIPDQVRFGHHFAESADRLQTPLIRRNGQLTPATWDEAIALVAEKLQQYRESATGLAGDRLSNEDLFLFQKLFRKTLKNDNIDLADNRLAGGDVTAEVGIASGTNLADLGKGDAVLVVASDLHASAPIWWLRLKQAAERGATLVVATVRPTRLDRYATHALRFHPAALADFVSDLTGGDSAAAEALRSAENLLVYYGNEGLEYAETEWLARSLGNLLIETGRFGREKNGLVAVWPHNNSQGAWDMGIVNRFAPGYREVRKPGLGSADVYAGKAQALYVLGADPVGDGLLPSRDGIEFLVVQEMFLTATAQLADVVLPARSWAERDGTFTSGDRRVQRYYLAITPIGESLPDWQIVARVIAAIDSAEKVPVAASLVFANEIAKGVRPYKGMSYVSLARVVPQFPLIGSEDLYYGGTGYENKVGIGQQWAAGTEGKSKAKAFDLPDLPPRPGGVTLVNVAAPLTTGSLLRHSAMLAQRLPAPEVILNSADAAKWNLHDGNPVSLRINGSDRDATIRVDDKSAQPDVVLLQGFGNSIRVEPLAL